MKKRHVLGAAALVVGLVVAWYLTAPYLTLWRLRDAVEAEDEEALRQIVDFPRVRANLAEDLQGVVGPEIEDRLGDRPLAGLGRMLGNAAVEEIVEAYVSPDGIFALARGRDPTGGGSAPREPPELTIDRRGLDAFAVTSETPVGRSPEFVFVRQGVVWRMVRIETGLGKAADGGG